MVVLKTTISSHSVRCETALTSSKLNIVGTFCPLHTFHTLLHMHGPTVSKHVPCLLTNPHVLFQRSLRCTRKAYTANTYTLVDLVVKNSNQERWYGWAGLLMRRDKEAAWLLEQCHYAADKQATPAVFTRCTPTTKAAPLNKPISRYSTEVGLSYTTKSNYTCNNYLAYVSCLKIHCLKETRRPQSDRGDFPSLWQYTNQRAASG